MRLRWAQLKTTHLIDLTARLAERVRAYRPEIRTARNLFASAVLDESAEQWLAQSLPAFVRGYDYTALMAMPHLEGAAEPHRWLETLVARVADVPGALDRTVFELRSDLRRSDAFVYALAIEGAEDRPSTRVNPAALRTFTDDTGGYTAVVKDVGQLASETARIAEELNHQYLLGYATPRPAADGAYHSIRVRLKKEGYFVRSRRGYFASKEE